MLTHKQERFAQSIADGKSQSDAYRAAYSCAKMMDKTIWEKASALMKTGGKVSARVDELRAALAKKHLWTREMSVKGLVQAYKISQEDRVAPGMIAAIKELNAMHGYNKPEGDETKDIKPAQINFIVADRVKHD